MDGRATAGHQGARVKHNRQIAEDSAARTRAGRGRDRGARAQSAVPERDAARRGSTRRCSTGTTARKECTSARTSTAPCGCCPGSGEKIRTDVSATLFLSRPDDYDGGELQIDDTYGAQRIKLPAGDLVLYPATSLHRVTPVTRGVRVACFFWVQSMVRDDAQRALLFDLDMAVVKLARDASGHESLVSLTGCYHNLLRMWAEP